MSQDNKFARKITHYDKEYKIFDLNKFSKQFNANISRLPYSIRVLLENTIRNGANEKTLEPFVKWSKGESFEGAGRGEINYYPARVLMQDFTGVPAVVDLAAMRDAINRRNFDPNKVNPMIPVDLIIDHSIQVDFFGEKSSLQKNTKLEIERNYERYKFLKWGSEAFKNLKVVPPGTGICHQVNLEYIANVVWTAEKDGEIIAYPDTLVGTDSHTTMINGLGILGWGVGGIEAEAAMLGAPLPMILPEVIGVELVGKLSEGVTATDLVLTVTESLRKKGVVGKFVEYFGTGLKHLTLADRATIANMSPEYGATCGFFPVDSQTKEYLQLTGRSQEQVELVEKYCKEQNLWFVEDDDIIYTDTIKINLDDIEPSLAGPKRPQDRLSLGKVRDGTIATIKEAGHKEEKINQEFKYSDDVNISHGDVVIAAITSCTNTSNPFVMIAAGIVAKKAVELGLSVKPWVKASLAPGSQVVTEYLDSTGLSSYLEKLKFNNVGYGCTTCIGNSGPLLPEIESVIKKNNLVVSSVLSGNRNFEGRVHPLTRANYLASPPLVVVYAIAGTTMIDLRVEPIAKDKNGNDIYMKDIWPSNDEVQKLVSSSVNSKMFTDKYSSVYEGDETWKSIEITKSSTYEWDDNSTYIKNPPFFEDFNSSTQTMTNIENARIIAIFGDSITTDHISPAGNIAEDSPAGIYLRSKGIKRKDFNSYGSRRGNHEVMMRGTFANIRVKNKMLDGVEGGYTKYFPTQDELEKDEDLRANLDASNSLNNEKLSDHFDDSVLAASNNTSHSSDLDNNTHMNTQYLQMPIYDAAMKYKNKDVPLVIFAGKEYGTGSSRDWAAKGTKLLGIKAVIAENFERIHRSNLVGMGVLPLEFVDTNLDNLKLSGDEEISIKGINNDIKPLQSLICEVKRDQKVINTFKVKAQILTDNEINYIKQGGILQDVAKKLCK